KQLFERLWVLHPSDHDGLDRSPRRYVRVELRAAESHLRHEATPEDGLNDDATEPVEPLLPGRAEQRLHARLHLRGPTTILERVHQLDELPSSIAGLLEEIRKHEPRFVAPWIRMNACE